MLCVYENLLNEYAEKYGIEGGLDVNDYVADIYDSLFSGAVYYTDDSLVFKAREELAKRILALKNEDKLVVSTDYNGKDATVSVYTTSPTLSINGDTTSGVVAGEGYKYTTTLSSSSASELEIVAKNGTYTHGIKGTAKITDFAANGTEGAVCSGRDGVDSTKSTITTDGDKARVMIRSYYAKGAGYGANVDVNGIDGPTSRLMPSVTFDVDDFSGANALRFSVKNVGSTVLEIYVHLIMDNGLSEEIGTAYCGLGKSNDVRIQISKLLNIDTSKVKGVKLAFKNVYADANGYESLWADREFELSDIWFEK